MSFHLHTFCVDSLQTFSSPVMPKWDLRLWSISLHLICLLCILGSCLSFSGWNCLLVLSQINKNTPFSVFIAEVRLNCSRWAEARLLIIPLILYCMSQVRARVAAVVTVFSFLTSCPFVSTWQTSSSAHPQNKKLLYMW